MVASAFRSSNPTVRDREHHEQHGRSVLRLQVGGTRPERRVFLELRLEHFVSRRVRQVVNEDDIPRHFLRREVLTAPFGDVFWGRALAGLEHDCDQYVVLAEFRGHRDRSRLVNRRMRADYAIELRTGDVLAPAADDVFLARNEKEITVGVPLHEVACFEPAVVERFGGLLWIAKIALHDDRGLHEKLAFFADRDIMSFVIDDAAFRPWAIRIGMTSDRTHAAGFAQTFYGIARDPGDFRHAVTTDEVRNPEFIAKRRFHAVAHAIDRAQSVLGTKLAARAILEYRADRFDDVDFGCAIFHRRLPE